MFHLISAPQCCYAILKTVLCWLNMHVACGMEWDNHNVIISFNCHSNLQVRMNCNIWLWLLTTHLIIPPDCTSWEVVCCLFSFSFFTFLSKEMISNLTIVNSNSNQSGEKYSSLFGIGERAIVHSFKVHWWIKHNNLSLGVSVVQYRYTV